ncbi:MAG: hypothetical protein GF401_09375 [Chitinivibrionales bacterium]|nr:hypothetical protein [Chitinivibrionales bacterium]
MDITIRNETQSDYRAVMQMIGDNGDPEESPEYPTLPKLSYSFTHR